MLKFQFELQIFGKHKILLFSNPQKLHSGSVSTDYVFIRCKNRFTATWKLYVIKGNEKKFLFRRFFFFWNEVNARRDV